MSWLLHRLWQSLVALGSLHTGPLHYEDSQLLSALGQVGCFVDQAPANRWPDARFPGPGRRGPGTR